MQDTYTSAKQDCAMNDVRECECKRSERCLNQQQCFHASGSVVYAMMGLGTKRIFKGLCLGEIGLSNSQSRRKWLKMSLNDEEDPFSLTRTSEDMNPASR